MRSLKPSLLSLNTGKLSVNYPKGMFSGILGKSSIWEARLKIMVQRCTSSKIVASFYDKDGKVIFTDWGYITPNTLKPGGIGSFKITQSPPKGLSKKITDVYVNVQSDEYAMVIPIPTTVEKTNITLPESHVRSQDSFPRLEQIATWSKFGSGKGSLNIPASIDNDKDGQRFSIADLDNNRVQVLGKDGNFINEWGW